MPKFEKSKGFGLKSGHNPSFKMMGSSPMHQNEGEPKEPVGPSRPGELRSQHLAREAEGIIDMTPIEPKKPSRIVSPERHAQEVEGYVKKSFGDVHHLNMLGLGLTDEVINNPDVWTTMGTLKRGVDPKIDAILAEGRGQTYSSGIVNELKDTGSSEIQLPKEGSTSIADVIQTPRTRKQKRKSKRKARKNK